MTNITCQTHEMIDQSGVPRHDVVDLSVYVLDDHEQVRRQIVALINAADGLTVVGSSGDAVVALGEILELKPQVAVLDGNVGDVDGLHVCRQIGAVAPEVACVMLTTGLGDSWGPLEAAEAGAEAFLLKQLSDFPLLDVIGRVGAGERLLDRYLVSRSPTVQVSPVTPVDEGQLGRANR